MHDPELIADLTKLVAKGRAKVILSAAGKVDPNAKDAPKPKKPMIWDAENHDARAALHAAKVGATQDRLFNNEDHIGHNKFLVFAKNGHAKAVLTGSTNWTETGLCTQSNNIIVVDDETVAGHYLDYWQRLRTDVQPDGVPVSAKKGRETIDGFAPNKGVQGDTLRRDNAMPVAPVSIGQVSVELFFSPNTKAPTKNAKSPTPVDLARVYSLMEHANQAIFFLTFYPGVRGEQNIIGEAARLASRQGLLVQGAISNSAALPPAKPGELDTYKAPDGKEEKLPQRAIWWPDGDDSKIVMVRAAAVSIQTGDLRPELLSAGHAIIHDKIIVIDPLDPVGCTVITGSHNLGFKASYQNDENMLIIRGNQPLAIAYAVHVLDTYDHYVMRAKLEDQRRKALIETGKEPPASSGGFLRLTDDWQDRWFKPGPAQAATISWGVETMDEAQIQALVQRLIAEERLRADFRDKLAVDEPIKKPWLSDNIKLLMVTLLIPALTWIVGQFLQERERIHVDAAKEIERTNLIVEAARQDARNDVAAMTALLPALADPDPKKSGLAIIVLTRLQDAQHGDPKIQALFATMNQRINTVLASPNPQDKNLGARQREVVQNAEPARACFSERSNSQQRGANGEDGEHRTVVSVWAGSDRQAVDFGADLGWRQVSCRKV